MSAGCVNAVPSDLILHVHEVEEVNMRGQFMPCDAVFR